MSDGRDDTQARPAGGVKPSPDLLQKWSRAPYWGPDEGVALAFGLDPARVIKSDIAGYHAPYLKAPDPAPHFAKFAHRAMAQGHLEHRAHPSDFINWAETVGLAFHDDWTSTLNPRIPAESKIDESKGSLWASPKKERGQPGARNKRICAAHRYVRLFPDCHEAENLSWQGACDAIVDDGGERVVPKTLKRGLKELGIR